MSDPGGPRLRLLIATAAIAALSGVSCIGTVAAPALMTRHPLLLVALSPRLPHLAVAAGAVPFPAFVAVAMVRLLAADPFHYLLGREGAGLIQARGGQAASMLDRARAGVARAGLLGIAVRPVGSVLAAAGAGGMRPLPTAIADVAGTLVQVVAVYHSGRAVGGFAPRLAPVAVALAVAIPAVVTVLAWARSRPSVPTARRRAAARG